MPFLCNAQSQFTGIWGTTFHQSQKEVVKSLKGKENIFFEKSLQDKMLVYKGVFAGAMADVVFMFQDSMLYTSMVTIDVNSGNAELRAAEILSGLEEKYGKGLYEGSIGIWNLNDVNNRNIRLIFKATRSEITIAASDIFLSGIADKKNHEKNKSDF